MIVTQLRRQSEFLLSPRCFITKGKEYLSPKIVGEVSLLFRHRGKAVRGRKWTRRVSLAFSEPQEGSHHQSLIYQAFFLACLFRQKEGMWQAQEEEEEEEEEEDGWRPRIAQSE